MDNVKIIPKNYWLYDFIRSDLILIKCTSCDTSFVHAFDENEGFSAFPKVCSICNSKMEGIVTRQLVIKPFKEVMNL